MDQNSSSVMEGRVEVCIDNTYGTVCDDRWGVLDARVVCRQLGMETDDAVPFRKAQFGMGTGPILLDDVMCDGTEASLMDCVSEQTNDCTHLEDAGVRCNGKLRTFLHDTTFSFIFTLLSLHTLSSFAFLTSLPPPLSLSPYPPPSHRVGHTDHTHTIISSF